MANPTAGVPTRSTPFVDEKLQWPLVSTAATYYVGEMIGLTTAGYAAKFDDTQSMKFLGFQADSVPIVVSGTGSNGDEKVMVEKPRYFEVKIASAAITDVGKLVYAKYSNEVQFSGSTYANVVGRVVRRVASDIVLVDCWDTGNAGRILAATGAQSVTKWDLNKTIFTPNTAAYTVTLPAVADTQAGDRLVFVKNTAAAFAVTLDGNASETIDGATTLATMDAQYDCATLVSNGSEWTVVSRDIA